MCLFLGVYWGLLYLQLRDKAFKCSRRASSCCCHGQGTHGNIWRGRCRVFLPSLHSWRFQPLVWNTMDGAQTTTLSRFLSLQLSPQWRGVSQRWELGLVCHTRQSLSLYFWCFLQRRGSSWEPWRNSATISRLLLCYLLPPRVGGDTNRLRWWRGSVNGCRRLTGSVMTYQSFLITSQPSEPSVRSSLVLCVRWFLCLWYSGQWLFLSRRGPLKLPTGERVRFVLPPHPATVTVSREVGGGCEGGKV